MKIKKNLFLFILFFSCTSLFAEEEIEVGLSTLNPLTPVYLSPIFNENAEFSAAYLKDLQEVLRFDLHCNGFFHVLKDEEQKNILLSKEDAVAFDFDFWKEKNVGYVFKATVNKADLHICVWSQETKRTWNCTKVKLEGN